MLCVRCKGKLLCGKSFCPIIRAFRSASLELGSIDEKPTPPSVFVGRVGYPKVFAGPMIVLGGGNPEVYENPSNYSQRVEDVIALRMSLARTYAQFSVHSAGDPDRNLMEIQEIASSVRNLDVEAEYEKVIRKPAIDDIVMPSGVSALFRRMKVTSNPKIPSKVEKISDDELKAVNAVVELYQENLPTAYIQRVFSVGLLGVEKKLVPTRWSITAVHDIIAENLKRDIADFERINDCLLFSYEHYGNHFEVILYPSSYVFQLVEIWMEKSLWSPENVWIGSDSEGLGRKKEYSELSGGYYAARLPVLEYLHSRRRQAGAIVLREIRPEYSAPLGVWVVEEGVRKAMNTRPERFSSLGEAVEHASKRMRVSKSLWEKHLKFTAQQTLDLFLRNSSHPPSQ
ncbi:Nre family DNA repair protein [Geoglobus acetivorans]|uniref:Nre family DNA repair protein n=1 Tax=Geoglobus acetivorans TaxID=565033 RepID=UPI000693E9E3